VSGQLLGVPEFVGDLGVFGDVGEMIIHFFSTISSMFCSVFVSTSQASCFCLMSLSISISGESS